MPDTLDKVMADSIATLVAVGFILENNRTSETLFGYEDKVEEKEKHDKLAAALGGVGVPVTFSALKPKGKQPCIFAKTKKTYSEEQLRGIADDLGAQVYTLELKANGNKVPPYGAYIGAKSSVSTIDFVGPSDLELYKPQFRPLADGVEDVRNSYGKAVQATNCALKTMKTMNGVRINSRVKITVANLIKEITESYADGYLFKSYHGMIKAMMYYTPATSGEDIFLELALGENTTKVASCLPCSLFMSANDQPATATHFGRGDNWNIPPNGSKGQMRKNWKTLVNQCCEEGIEKLKGINKKIENAVEYLAENKGSTPEIFLESLTFEGSFMDRIMTTLK
jgi:hypothetical protein